MPVTNLRLKMMEDGRPQHQIAAAAQLPPSRISEYALGRKNIPQRNLMKIAFALRCNPDEIVGFATEVEL